MFLGQAFKGYGGTFVFAGLSNQAQQGVPSFRRDFRGQVKIEKYDSRGQSSPEFAEARRGEQIEASNDQDLERYACNDLKILVGVGRDSSPFNLSDGRTFDGRKKGELCAAIGVTAGLRQPGPSIEQGR
jgi:hypothetical protein